MSELFDIFDEGMNHVGIKPRAEVHRDGDWHQVFHCWVVGRDPDGEAYVILQKRARGKDYPGKVDLSAAGHLEAGETVRDGVREIEEELGLKVDYEDLIPLGRRVGITKDGDLIDCQICHVFLYQCDQPLDAYTYPLDEVDGLLKLNLSDGVRLLCGESLQVCARAVGLGADEVVVRSCDFISSVDNYALKALMLAQRYFAGERRLWI